MIDTFAQNGVPEKITAVFWVNVDSDNVKEMVVMTTSIRKDKDASGTFYINRVYDDVAKGTPAKMKKLEDVSAKIDGGFEGVTAGKPGKAKYKNEKEVVDALKKLGFQ